MATANQFTLRASYNFSFYAPAFLGAGLAGATVMGIIDTATANQDINTQVLHAQIFPLLPAGTPNDPNLYNFVKFKTSAGNVVIYGLPWIVASSVEQIDSQTIIATIPNVSVGDIDNIQAALAANGYSGVTFSIQSN